MGRKGTGLCVPLVLAVRLLAQEGNSPAAASSPPNGSAAGAPQPTSDRWHEVSPLCSVDQIGVGNGAEGNKRLRVEEVLGDDNATLGANRVAQRDGPEMFDHGQ